MTAKPAPLFDVHEYTPGRFVWYVHDPDTGEVVDAWNRDYAYEGDHHSGRPTGADGFRTEDEAIAHVLKRHPRAVNVHRYIKG